MIQIKIIKMLVKLNINVKYFLKIKDSKNIFAEYQ